MSFITLDFETYYEKTKYTLKALTYEEYIFNPLFHVHSVGVKINRSPTIYVPDTHVKEYLSALFEPGNDHTLLAHNTLFDGAILNWYYGLSAATYYCTQAMSRALWNHEEHSLGALAARCWPDGSRKKGNELSQFAGVSRLTSEQHEILKPYCLNDVDLTFDAFAQMLQWFPREELPVLDTTLRMFVEPAFICDKPRLQAYIDRKTKEDAIVFAKAEFPRHVLSSTRKFAIYLRAKKGIRVKKIPSPTKKNPLNKKYPFAKDDLAFLDLQAKYPELQHIWEGRLLAASNLDLKRAERMLIHCQDNGRIAIPLNYAAAHTLRWGGTNRMN